MSEIQALNQDEVFMTRAIELAEKAEAIDEVPVGAVIVLDGIIIGEGYNQSISLNDPSAHAEMIALREAAVNVDNYRVLDATLYVTLEPCPMCAGALVHGRIKRLVFGTYDMKTGASGSVMDITNHAGLNHQVLVEGGCLQAECSAQISAFFKRRRAQKKQQKHLGE